MTGPALSRAECQRLSGLVRLGLKAGLFGVQYEDLLKIADLVEAYPIAGDGLASRPTREGAERAAEILAVHRDLIQKIHGDYPVCTRKMVAEALDLAVSVLSAALPPEDGERAQAAQDLGFACNDLRHYAVGGRAAAIAAMERAAALLRQPPPPAAGVSKERVLAAINDKGNWGWFHQREWVPKDNLLARIDDLPEAAPQPTPKRSPLPEAPGGWWCCSADYPNHDPGCRNAAAPPSGVDREAVLAILSRAALELSPDMTEAATIADCIVLIRDLPEAKL